MSDRFDFKHAVKCWPRKGMSMTCPTCSETLKGHLQSGFLHERAVVAVCRHCGLSMLLKPFDHTTGEVSE